MKGQVICDALVWALGSTVILRGPDGVEREIGKVTSIEYDLPPYEVASTGGRRQFKPGSKVLGKLDFSGQLTG